MCGIEESSSGYPVKDHPRPEELCHRECFVLISPASGLSAPDLPLVYAAVFVASFSRRTSTFMMPVEKGE